MSFTVFHAGCVTTEVNETARRLSELYPKKEIILKSGGSVEIIRKMLAGEDCDLLISADDKIIEMMMMPKYTDGYLIFAGNEMAIMSTDESGTINEENWVEILSDSETKWGYFNPDVDPGGYRGNMVCQLADNHIKGLSKTFLNHPNKRIQYDKNEIVSQYTIGYLSNAVKRGFAYAKLPETMNLGNEKYEAIYNTAKYDFGEYEVKGSTISHALTIPLSSKDKEFAKVFIDEFLKTDFKKQGFKVKSQIIGNGI